jgi:hypothetical protein
MKRRDFLWTIGAAGLAGHSLKAQGARRPSTSLRAGGTILYDSRSVSLNRVDVDAAGALWVQKRDLPRINGFELKPQGMCREEICVPVPRAMSRGDQFNLTAFAGRVGQKVIADPAGRVWSFGEIPVVQGAYIESRLAPDVEVPDRKGRPVRLSQFRGKKVLLVTWASW